MVEKTFWDGLLTDIINADKPPASTHASPKETHHPSSRHKPLINRRRTRTRYISLGNTLPCSMITAREADCLLHFAQGKTIRSTAEALELSPRTVEFYLKNMKSKLQCHSKSEFVQKIITHVSLDAVRQQLDAIDQQLTNKDPAGSISANNNTAENPNAKHHTDVEALHPQQEALQ